MGAHEDFLAGLEQARMGHYEAAIEGFKSAIAQTSDEAIKKNVWWNIAICHMRLGQIEEASAAAELAGHTAPADEAMIETWGDLHEAGAASAASLGQELKQTGDMRGAIAAFDAALHDENLDDDTRAFLFGRIAMCYLELLEWGKAEEYAAAMTPSERPGYDERREQLMKDHNVTAADLAHYDGSAFDDEFARAKERFAAQDYTGALTILDKIVGPTIDHGAFGEEVWLYVSLCNLYTGDLATAEGYGSFLTGAWLDSYNEHKAALHPA